MKLNDRAIQQLEAFLNQCEQQVYSEPATEGTFRCVQNNIDYIKGRFPEAFRGKVLDIGCGQGGALEIFRQMGLETVGVTLDPDDFQVCRQKGFEVYRMDQSFLEFPDGSFDLLWCRHCLEHSIFPFFTLTGFYRVLKPGGYCFIEVPAPDTVIGHQTNTNHYSVFGFSMWMELMKRTGFTGETMDIAVKTVDGRDDLYWGFILQKPLSKT